MSGGSRAHATHRRRTSEKLQALVALVSRGLSWAWAALGVGVHPSTARRWRRRESAGEPLVRRRGRHALPVTEAACADARRLVRNTHGLIGASALSHSVVGLSRRVAAQLKDETCGALERERRGQAQQVHVAAPGLVRGFDAMAVPHGHLLIAADGCVPYRTSWTRVRRYDGPAVATLLERDFDSHGAPLVLRLDRAKAHDVPAVHEVLDAGGVLPLQGPPNYPCYYGQLERQNLEHRLWLAADPTASLDLEAMMAVMNDQWRRNTLGWQTAGEIWATRPVITTDRRELAEDVRERAWNLQHCRHGSPLSQDLAWRLAVKQALVNRGLLRIENGGWC